MRAIVRIRMVVSLLGLALVLLAGPAPAGEKPSGDQEVKPTQQWKGSVDDENLQKKAPAQGIITDGMELKRLWQEWHLGDKVPAVKFDKELVLVETTRGSLLQVGVKLTAKGDLQVLGIATRDFRPGFRYKILVVPRAGVKTVNGKELPKG